MSEKVVEISVVELDCLRSHVMDYLVVELGCLRKRVRDYLDKTYFAPRMGDEDECSSSYDNDAEIYGKSIDDINGCIDGCFRDIDKINKLIENEGII